MTVVPSRAYTHAGVFHADDVFSAALLTMLNPSIQLQRGFCPPEGFDGVVFDIGGGEFDHHNRDRRMRPNGIPYASFGLLWECFGTCLLGADDAAAFDEAFVQPIDDADNGGAPCLLTQLVSDFNPKESSDTSAYDTAFQEAVAWAAGVLRRRIDAVAQVSKVRAYVVARMEECDGSILVLNRTVPWKDAVVGSTYAYVVSPSIRGGFNVQAVPEKLGSNSMLRPFPLAWRGATADELQEITGVGDLLFCHASGFLCVASTLGGAIEAARVSLAAATTD